MSPKRAICYQTERASRSFNLGKDQLSRSTSLLRETNSTVKRFLSRWRFGLPGKAKFMVKSYFKSCCIRMERIAGKMAAWSDSIRQFVRSSMPPVETIGYSCSRMGLFTSKLSNKHLTASVYNLGKTSLVSSVILTVLAKQSGFSS